MSVEDQGVEPQIDDGRTQIEPAPRAEDFEPAPRAAPEPPLELEIASSDRLNNIYENARVQRDADDADEQQAFAGEPEPEPEQYLEQPQGSPHFRVRVDGRDAEVSLDDLVRTYQINSAADVRLQDATRIRAEAQRILQAAAANAQPTQQGGEQGAPTGDPRQQGQPTPDGAVFTEQELREAAELLQLGTTEQAANVLRVLSSRIAAPPQPVAFDARSQVRSVLAEDRDDSISEAAVTQFFNAFPLLGEDEVAQGALKTASELEMMRDFAARGIPEDILRGVSRENMADTHRKLRMRGEPGFRQTHELLAAVAYQPRFQNFANGYGMRPLQVQLDRSERKQAVQAQPALRTASQHMPQERQARTPEQAASDWVAQMRKDRGLAPAYG